MPGADTGAKLDAAQRQLAAKGGGVVYFAPGEYRFKDSIKLLSGIILRGAAPTRETDARKDGYRLESRLEFPKYEFGPEGDGTPNSTAFKAVELADPATAVNCGVVDLAIHRGHILLGEDKDHHCGGNRLVYGCILTDTAYPWPAVPNAKNGQHGWQRYTHPFGAAIEVKSAENLLIANNRLPQSGGDNFTMNGYVLFDRKRQPTKIDGLVFDYDNRAVEIRGWRWVVTGNDYEVHSNWCADRSFRFNDGEGLMHEDHCNSTIKDSILRGNKGNRYLSLYWCAGIDGLLVEINDIQVDRQQDGAIWVDANRTSGQFPIRNVTIRNNRVNGGIRISGSPAENNVISGNRFTGQGESKIDNFANARIDGNQGFTVNTQRGEKEKKMFGIK